LLDALLAEFGVFFDGFAFRSARRERRRRCRFTRVTSVPPATTPDIHVLPPPIIASHPFRRERFAAAD